MDVSRPSLKDTHYRLSKKVAQLTKVVVRLNIANESVDLDKKKLTEAHAKEIKTIKEETNDKFDLLNSEIKVKERTLVELKEAQQRQIDIGKEAEERLATVESNANAKEIELRSLHEKEIKTLTERLTNKLSIQSKKTENLSLQMEELFEKHRSEVETLREKLKNEHHLALKQLREELINIHSDEIYRLKSRHEKSEAQWKADAVEHEKLEVENAVTLVKAEYEQKIYQQIIQNNQACQKIKADVSKRLNADILNLQEELNLTKVVADEVPTLKTKLYELIGHNKKLSSEVRRLQASLDASNASNQQIINHLNGDKDELHSEIREISRVLDDHTEQVRILQDQNIDLKHQLDMTSNEKTSLETDLQQLEKKCSQLCEDIDNNCSIVTTLQAELNHSNETRAALDQQLKIAQKNIADLSKYQLCVVESRKQVRDVRSVLNHIQKEVQEMQPLFISSQSLVADYKSKLRSLHSSEILQLENQTIFLKDEVKKLESIKIIIEQNLSETESEKANLEQRIKTLEHAATNAESAHHGERLSYKKAMEEMQARHKKEKFHMQIVSQDEKDILKNKIVQLESDILQQQERNDHQRQIIEADCSDKIESINAALSRTKYESDIEIKNLANENNNMTNQLNTQKERCASLIRHSSDLEQHIKCLREKHQKVIDTLTQKHRKDTEETIRVHVELFRQHEAKFVKDEQDIAEKLKQSEREIEIITSKNRFQSDRIKSRTATVVQVLNIQKQQFQDVKVFIQQYLDMKSIFDQCENELSNKLQSMRQCCISIINEKKMIHTQIVAQLNDSCDEKIAAANREVEDAKKILFQSVREHEMKLEQEIRHIKEEHSLQIGAIKAENKANYEELSSKFKNLCQELETVKALNGEKEVKLSEREKKIRFLEMKITDLTKLHDDEILSVAFQHQTERNRLIKDAIAKETMIKDEFIEEKRRLQCELKEVECQLNEVKEQCSKKTSNEALTLEHIKELQGELNTLIHTEKQTKEKMLFYKREIENRETNYNKRFSSAGMRRKTYSTKEDGKSDTTGVLRVIQSPPKKKDASMTTIPKKLIQKNSTRIVNRDTKKKALKIIKS